MGRTSRIPGLFVALSVLMLNYDVATSTHTLLAPEAMHPIQTPDMAGVPPGVFPPNEYVVYLHPDYSYEQHCTTIGVDLKSFLRRLYKPDIELGWPENYEYIIEVEPERQEEIISLIRRDPGVKKVGNPVARAWIDPIELMPADENHPWHENNFDYGKREEL
jgi:hypothetical protein